MEGIIPKLARQRKRRLARIARHCQDGPLRTRYLIIVNLADGRTPGDVAACQNVSRSTVYRVAARFCELDEGGLIDRREENGDRKLTEEYPSQLLAVVALSPQEHGWPRPTWTQEMLIETLEKKTRIAVSRATMSDALHAIGARRGRPKPTVRCPWSTRRRNQRLRDIPHLIETRADDAVAG